VGVNYEDGQNVLVLWRLFGLLVRESRCWRWWVPTWRMGKACWLCGDFLVCWCGEVGVGGGGCQRGGWAKCVGFVVTFRRVSAGKSTLNCLFYCESVRSPLICLGGAWAGCLRRRSSLCQAAGTSLAALPAVLWVVAHDSRPASYPTNVACNSLDTVSHRATISLGLQRLRTLLKVHSIELHAKLLRAR